MKTREEFVLLADEYRKEIRWRAWLFLLAILLSFFVAIAPALIITHIIGYHSAGGLIWIGIFLVILIGLNLYQSKSQESLARKMELVCPHCSRVLVRQLDLKLAIATHNCPHCGDRIFS